MTDSAVGQCVRAQAFRFAHSLVPSLQKDTLSSILYSVLERNEIITISEKLTKCRKEQHNLKTSVFLKGCSEYMWRLQRREGSSVELEKDSKMET